MRQDRLLPPASLIRGCFWMSGTVISFVGMAIAGRELSDTFNTFQILTFRSLIALVVTILVVISVGWHVLRTERFFLHCFRNIFHFGGQFGWFLGISLLPLATVFALEYAIPVWTALLATIFLGERMHHARVLAICFGVVGVGLILRPGLNIIDPAAVVVIGAAFCYAVSYIVTKSMTKTEHPLAILFYMNLIQFPLAFLPATFNWVTPSTSDLQWILAVGFGGFCSHYCLTRAFQVADTLTVIPIDFMRLPIIAIIGYFYYSEPLEIALLFGGLVIFLGNYYNIRYESVQPKPI